MTTAELAALSDAELIALANADMDDRDEPTELPETEIDIVLRIANANGRKFEVTDITHTGATGQFLYDAASAWLGTDAAKNHDLPFVADIARKHARGGGLTDGQAKGILNCMVAGARRMDRRERPEGDARQRYAVNAAGMDGFVSGIDQEIDHADEYAAHVAEQSAETVAQGFYTIVRPDGRLTVKVSKWLDDDRRPGRKIRFISMLVGPDNTGDYQCFARQGDDHRLPTVTQKYRVGHGRWIDAMMALFDGTAREAQMAYAVASGNCARCNRVLTVPGWEDRGGLGPECFKKGGE
jgi:hypothetical protein